MHSVHKSKLLRWFTHFYLQPIYLFWAHTDIFFSFRGYIYIWNALQVSLSKYELMICSVLHTWFLSNSLHLCNVIITNLAMKQRILRVTLDIFPILLYNTQCTQKLLLIFFSVLSCTSYLKSVHIQCMHFDELGHMHISW